MQDATLLNLGYGNLVLASRVVAIVSPQSAPMKRLREDASSRGKLIDATQGRRTRSIIVTDSDHVILSAINPETIAGRLHSEPETIAGSLHPEPETIAGSLPPEPETIAGSLPPEPETEETP